MMVPDSPVNEERVIRQIAQNLGISEEALLADPTFRREIGADDLDRLEAMLRQESGE
jgi:hypothetical protein